MRTKTTLPWKPVCLKLRLLMLLFISLLYFKPLFAQQQQYNVLFIAVDDMNDRVSFLGNPEVVAPNLQRLVNHGMVFTSAYAQYALCNPSRTSILSGWRPESTKIYVNDVRPGTVMRNDVLHLPEFFHQYGYHTERYGKIAHDLFESDINWDYAEPGDRAGEDNASGFTNSLTATTTYAGGDWWIKNVPDSTIDDGIIARHLLARMKQPQTFPFFYGLGFHSPHAPFTPSTPYWNLNGDPGVQELLQVNNSGKLGNIKGNGSSNILFPLTPLNDRSDIPTIAFNGKQKIFPNPAWQKAIHAYDAEVSQMDAQLGLVLDQLDRQNLWSNTIVVFWSDHGQHLGEHEGQWLKLTLFEESVHVPLIVCVPGKKPGVCNRLVELVDLYPTLAELCGLPAPQGMEGSSFASLLDNPGQPWKRAAFSEVQRAGIPMGRSVRAEQYRYTSWANSGEELYDHYSDPHEYTNLAQNPYYAVIVDSMRKILKEGWTQSLPPLTNDIVCYRDADSDGYGSATDSIFNRTVPPGYVASAGDFNDADSSIHPGAVERCNNIDDNCNGQIDENIIPDKVFYRDADADGFGSILDSIIACSLPSGYAINNTDCDDADVSVYPGAPELPDGIDNNCNGEIDENLFPAKVFYRDADADGFGNAPDSIMADNAPQGYVSNSTDCDDASALVYPGAQEMPDGIDNNCNGEIDEPTMQYADSDHDGYGNPANFIIALSVLPGYVSNNIDCDDQNPASYPGAVEILNGVDDNCNGLIDEELLSLTTYYRDSDEDGYGDSGKPLTSNTKPPGYVTNSGDCNDHNLYMHPGAVDLCNGIDDNCDGIVDENAFTAIVNPALSFNICSGSSVMLTTNSRDDLSYQWYKNSLAVTGAISQSLTVSVAGSYSVVELSRIYCDQTSPSTRITTSAIPAATISYTGSLNICSSKSVVLTANAGSGYIYQWQKDGVNIAGAVKKQYTATSSGNYKVLVITANGCSKLSGGVTVTNSCGSLLLYAGINTSDAGIGDSDVLFLYPNPSAGKIKLSYKSAEAGKVQIAVFDVTGRKVFSSNNSAVKGDNLFDLDLSSLNQGIYHLELMNNNKRINARITIAQ